MGSGAQPVPMRCDDEVRKCGNTAAEENGIYFVDYRVNGRRVRKCFGKSKKISELALKDLEVKLARNELDFIPKGEDLAKLFENFKSYSKTNHSPKKRQEKLTSEPSLSLLVFL